jgi:hypothetical protein
MTCVDGALRSGAGSERKAILAKILEWQQLIELIQL